MLPQKDSPPPPRYDDRDGWFDYTFPEFPHRFMFRVEDDIILLYAIREELRKQGIASDVMQFNDANLDNLSNGRAPEATKVGPDQWMVVVQGEASIKQLESIFKPSQRVIEARESMKLAGETSSPEL